MHQIQLWILWIIRAQIASCSAVATCGLFHLSFEILTFCMDAHPGLWHWGFITYCVLGNVPGCDRNMRHACKTSVPWLCMCPVSRSVQMTHSFISDKRWMETNGATAHRLVSFVLLVTVNLFFSGSPLIRTHTDPHTHKHTGCTRIDAEHYMKVKQSAVLSGWT